MALVLASGLVLLISVSLAIAVILYATCHLTHANPYLAAFAPSGDRAQASTK